MISNSIIHRDIEQEWGMLDDNTDDKFSSYTNNIVKFSDWRYTSKHYTICMLLRQILNDI